MDYNSRAAVLVIYIRVCFCSSLESIVQSVFMDLYNDCLLCLFQFLADLVLIYGISVVVVQRRIVEPQHLYIVIIS